MGGLVWLKYSYVTIEDKKKYFTHTNIFQLKLVTEICKHIHTEAMSKLFPASQVTTEPMSFHRGERTRMTMMYLKGKCFDTY